MVLEEDEDRKIKKSIDDDLREAIDHGILVSMLARLLSTTLNKDEEFTHLMAQAGLVHDIGKLKLGEYLYGRKKGVLAIEEMKYIRMHPTLGYEILIKENYNQIITEAVLHHHENYDGSGYPSNLKEDNIPYGARILRICDVFAALISKRRYRSSFDIDTAIELMIDEVKNFDMEIFLSFLQAVHSEKMKEILDYVHSINSKYDF